MAEPLHYDTQGRRICGLGMAVEYDGLMHYATCPLGHAREDLRRHELGPFRCHRPVRPTTLEVEQLREDANESLRDLIESLPSVPAQPNMEAYDAGVVRVLTRKSNARFMRALSEWAARLEALGDTWARTDLEARWTY